MSACITYVKKKKNQSAKPPPFLDAHRHTSIRNTQARTRHSLDGLMNIKYIKHAKSTLEINNKIYKRISKSFFTRSSHEDVVLKVVDWMQHGRAHRWMHTAAYIF